MARPLKPHTLGSAAAPFWSLSFNEQDKTLLCVFTLSSLFSQLIKQLLGMSNSTNS